MAIGTVAGATLATTELEVGQVTLMDHEEYTVVEVTFDSKRGFWVVGLEPPVGEQYDVEVHVNEASEPIWEMA